MTSSPFLRSSAGLFAALLTSSFAFAQSVTTDPVGFVTVNFKQNSDSYTFVPFKRTPEYAGAVVTPNGVSGDQISVAGTPNFTANQFVNSTGTQPRCYVLFTSGTKTGLFYSVVANSSTSLTVDRAGDDLSSAAGASFQVIPYDTLGSVFPSGQGITASPGMGLVERATEILVPSNSAAGTDLAAAKIYFYYSGASFGGPGWRSTSSPLTAVVNDTVLFPDTHFVVRQNTGVDAQATFVGAVHMGTLKTPLGTIAANQDQDNAIALPIPTELTLAESKLFESGAFTGSAGMGLIDRKDELYVRDNNLAGRDKAADAVYFYYTGGSFNGPGWRRTDDTLLNKHDSDVVFSTRFGLTVRKRSSGAPGSVLWTVKPPYVPAGTP
ncbi:MAG TPA: TIGR02597 family protein [Chthoniobacteraceae bacterium]|jgi:uncharacterized protein (TIGR02597 family)